MILYIVMNHAHIELKEIILVISSIFLMKSLRQRRRYSTGGACSSSQEPRRPPGGDLSLRVVVLQNCEFNTMRNQIPSSHMCAYHCNLNPQTIYVIDNKWPTQGVVLDVCSTSTPLNHKPTYYPSIPDGLCCSHHAGCSSVVFCWLQWDTKVVEYVRIFFYPTNKCAGMP